MNNVPVPTVPFFEHPSEQNNFLLRFWGGNEDAVRQKLRLKMDWASRFDGGWGGSYIWFSSLKNLETISDYIHTWDALVASRYEGKDAIQRKSLFLYFRYKGKGYTIKEKLGYGANDHDVEFYYTEGNMGCICNQSILLNRYYPEIPEMDCDGKGITFEKLSIIPDSTPIDIALKRLKGGSNS